MTYSPHLAENRTPARLPSARHAAYLILLFAAWLCVVLYFDAHHAFWRDEVRALSLATNGSTLVEMFKGLRGDAHPALWQILLLTTARRVGAERRAPVLILMMNRLPNDHAVTYHEGYNWTLSMTPEEVGRFTAATRLVRRFGPAISDETYWAYELPAPSRGTLSP